MPIISQFFGIIIYNIICPDELYNNSKVKDGGND